MTTDTEKTSIEETEKTSNMVDKDELLNVAEIIRSSRYVIQEIQEGFFDAFNPNKKEDICYIAYEFSRYRAYADIISRGLYEIENDLTELGITVD